MPTIHQITLKRDFKGVPKGTTCRIVTSSEADHSTDNISRALRMEEFYDEDFDGIQTSAYWEWKVITSDPSECNALSGELAKYQLPVHDPDLAEETQENKKSEKKKKNKEKKEKKGYWRYWCRQVGVFMWILWPIFLVIWIPYIIIKLVGIKKIFELLFGSND